MPLMADQTAQALKWIKFVLTLLQVIGMLPFKPHIELGVCWCGMLQDLL
jgi:hypothetical protein